MRKLRLYPAQLLWPSCDINKTLLAILKRGGAFQYVPLCLPFSVEITSKTWAILHLSIYIGGKNSCHVISVTGGPTQYVQTAFKSRSMALSAEMTTLHIHSQACISPLLAHSCSRLSFHVYSSQAQASIVPHFLYMVFSSTAAPASTAKNEPGPLNLCLLENSPTTLLNATHRWIKHLPWLYPGETDIIS